MEEQNKKTVGMMYPDSPGKQFWHIWGPLIIKMGIGFIISSIAAAIFGVYYLCRHYGINAEVLADARQMQIISERFMRDSMELAQTISLKFYDYTTLVDGVASLITIPVMWFMFHRDRVRERRVGFVPNKKAPLWKYVAVIIMGIALCVAMNNLILIGNFSSISEEYEALMEAIYSAPVPIQVLSLGILVPICEELVFRGLIFKRIRMRTTYFQAAFHSALVFGIMHMNLIQMFYGFFLGIVFAYAYEKYGSVKAPIAAHVAANLVSVLGTNYNWFTWMMEDPMRIVVITVICAAAAATMFVFMQRIEEKPDKIMLQNC